MSPSIGTSLFGLTRAEELSLRRLRAGQGRPAGEHLGRHAAKKGRGAGEFREYAPYQPGDDLRRVDWPLAARSGKLWVRRGAEERGGRMRLVVDASTSMRTPSPHGGGTGLTGALRFALYVGAWRIFLGEEMRLHALGMAGPSPSLRSPSRYFRALDSLAASRSDDAPLPELLERHLEVLRPGDDFAVASDFFCEPSEIEPVFRQATARGAVPFLIQTRDGLEDQGLPDRSRWIDSETGEIEESGSLGERSAWARAARAHRDEFEALCRARGWGYLAWADGAASFSSFLAWASR